MLEMVEKDRLRLEGFAEVAHAHDPVGVYCLLDHGLVVYVGQSISVYRRLAEHYWRMRAKRRPFEIALSPGDSRLLRIQFDSVMVRWCRKSELDDIEEGLIRRFKPRHNVVVREKLPNIPVDLELLGLEAVDTSFRRRHL